jgi:hypothetical protein
MTGYGLNALAELHARDVANGIDPLEIRRTPDPPTVLGPPLRIMPADWPAPLADVDEDTEARPAKPGERSWSAEQIRPDLGDQP